MILLFGVQFEALSQQLDNKIRNYADRDANEIRIRQLALVDAMILRNSKLSASNLIKQLIQDSKLFTDRDAMRFGSDTRS